MDFVAKALYIPYSPYKLRPLASVMREKRSVLYALQWLNVYKSKRSVPLKKALESAVANARNLKNLTPESLLIKEICVDQGPTHRYYKPGAMGRANVQTRRSCHITVKLIEAQSKEGSKHKGSDRGTKG